MLIYRAELIWNFWDSFFEKDVPYTRLRDIDVLDGAARENSFGVWFFLEESDAVKMQRTEPDHDSFAFGLPALVRGCRRGFLGGGRADQQIRVITRMNVEIPCNEIHLDRPLLHRFKSSRFHSCRIDGNDVPKSAYITWARSLPSSSVEVLFGGHWNAKTIEQGNDWRAAIMTGRVDVRDFIHPDNEEFFKNLDSSFAPEG